MYYRTRYFSKSHLDWPLFLGILIVALLGLFILYSATEDIQVLFRQLQRIGFAFLLMAGIAQIPPRFFRWIAPLLYLGAVTLLTTVLVLGDISKGGQRWLDLWIVRFQPAELTKLAVPLMLARYFDDQTYPPKLRHLIIPFILLFLPFILIAKQPDLGTAILILSSGLFIIFFSGISWKMILSLSGSAIAALPLLWYFMKEYQRQRVLTFLDPGQDPLGAGYQIIQSKIAIGSGGLYGKGWLTGTQAHLEFLPEQATDFIFAVFGEEFGLMGALILLGLYLYIIIRGLIIGVAAQNTFCRLLSGSLIMTFFVYIIVNIGMVTGILPVVGIPLPLISYGGTSLVTLMIGFGILMSIGTHRTLLHR